MRTALPILGLTGLLVASACGTSRVPPPNGAAPDVVARAYLDALVARDCTATRALMSHGTDPVSRDLCGLGRVEGYRGLSGAAGTDDVEFGVALVFRDMPRTAGWDNGDAGVFIRLVHAPGGPWRVDGIASSP